ncbi:MAG: hypothetical protein LBB61_04460 [Treponema sp.]|nr:hypothetical protein [Treponema sp.]
MKKNRLFIVGLAGMMTAALILSGCDPGEKDNNDPKKIIITGIPKEAKNGAGAIYLASSKSSNGIVAGGTGVVSNGSAEAYLYKINGNAASVDRWTGTGSYYVVIAGEENNDEDRVFISKTKIEINNATTIIPFSSFEEVEDPESLIDGGKLPNNPSKKIVITGIPEGVTGTGQVTLASSLSEAGIVAMGQGTISNRKAEADLYKFVNGSYTTEKWTGTGLYYVVIGGKDENGDSKTFVSKDKIDISNATTIIPFDSFEEMDGGGDDALIEDSGGSGGASAEQPKQIVIIGIPDEATGIRQVTLAGNPFGTGIVAKGTISAGTAELYMVVGETLTVERWTGTGLYYVVIAVAGDSKTFVSKDRIEIKNATTTISFSSFEEIMEAKDAEADGGGE